MGKILKWITILIVIVIVSIIFNALMESKQEKIDICYELKGCIKYKCLMNISIDFVSASRRAYDTCLLEEIAKGN